MLMKVLCIASAVFAQDVYAIAREQISGKLMRRQDHRHRSGPAVSTRDLERATEGTWKCVGKNCTWQPAFPPRCDHVSGCPTRHMPHARCCAGRRFLFYGSSHLRAVVFSFISLLKQEPLESLTPQQRQISSLTKPADSKMCNSWKKEKDMKKDDDPPCAGDWARPFAQNGTLCRYPWDVGMNTKGCGFPQMKLWDFSYDSANCKVSAREGKVAPINSIELPWPGESMKKEAVNVLFGFKSWVETEESDQHFLHHMWQFMPDVVVLGLPSWGCQPDPTPQVGVEHKANLSCQAHYQAAVARIDAFVDPDITIVHFVQRGGTNDEAKWSDWIHSGVARLSNPVRKARHIVLDKDNLLKKLPDNETKKHGFEGAATGIWASALMNTFC